MVIPMQALPEQMWKGVCVQAAKRWHALTSLKELDVSYCSLSTAVLANVIARGSTLQVLAQLWHSSIRASPSESGR